MEIEQRLPSEGVSERTLSVWKAVYIALMAFNLLSYSYLLAFGAAIDSIPPILWVTRLAAVPLAIWLGKMWKDRGFWILSVYFAWFFVRLCFPTTDRLFSNEGSENVLSGLFEFAACYGLGRILTGRELKRFLGVFASVWTVTVVVYCSVGIYAAWTNQLIPSLGQGAYDIFSRQRLDMIYLSTTSGSIVSVGSLIAIISAVSVKNRAGKVLFCLALIPMMLAMALTDSRTAFVSFPAGVGVLVLTGVLARFQKNGGSAKKAWAIGIPLMFAVFAALFFTIPRIVPVFNRLKIHGLVPAALAEGGENVQQAIVQRSFSGGASLVLNGRFELWGKVFNRLFTHPISLLVGESKYFPTSSFNEFFAHCHCIYLQVLLESGIPGLLMVLSFLGMTVVNGFRAITKKETPMLVKMIFAIVVSLCVGDLVESFMWLRSSQCMMTATIFVCAGILNNQESSLFRNKSRLEA